MQIKTPCFFYKKSAMPYILFPFSIIFGLCVIIFYFIIRRKKRKLKYPKVICIGSCISGGSGKTPISISFAQYLEKLGYKCCFLTIGFGRKAKNDFFIKKNNPDNFKSFQVGDEPLLLSQFADVFVVKKRHLVSKKIETYDFVICDDGLLDDGLYFDIKIATISMEYGFGNGFLIPAGPIRVPMFISKIFSDWLIVINNKSVKGINIVGSSKMNEYITYFTSRNKIIYANTKIISFLNKDRQYLAFCGLANCDKFFNTLENEKYILNEKIRFPDHYEYTKEDIYKIMQKAKEKKLFVVTTEKDYVKIHNLGNFDIEVVKIEIETQNLDKIFHV